MNARAKRWVLKLYVCSKKGVFISGASKNGGLKMHAPEIGVFLKSEISRN